MITTLILLEITIKNILKQKLLYHPPHTQKLNARNSFRSGFIFNQLGYDLFEKGLNEENILKE